MPAHKIKITKAQLLKTYVKKVLSAKETGTLFGCSRRAILRRLREFGIHVRTKSEVLRLRLRKFKITKKELYDLYWPKNMTTHKIGEIFGVSGNTVSNRLKEFNIPRRDAKENFKHMKFTGKDNFNYTEIPDDELLDLRLNKKLTTRQIAKKYGCHYSTICEKLKKLGIETVRVDSRGEKPRCIDCNKSLSRFDAIRCDDCNRKFNTGENHPMFGKHFFLGEKSHFYVDGRTPLNHLIRNLVECENWRNQIFERDNYTCQECYKRGVRLEAHHIKPFSIILTEFLQKYSQFSPLEDKEILVRLAFTYKPFWDLDNGRTLCEKCHNKKRKETLNKIKESKR